MKPILETINKVALPSKCGIYLATYTKWVAKPLAPVTQVIPDTFDEHSLFLVRIEGVEPYLKVTSVESLYTAIKQDFKVEYGYLTLHDSNTRLGFLARLVLEQ